MIPLDSRHWSAYFSFPAWVEICRQAKGIQIPADLEASYFKALQQLPELAAAAASAEWDHEFCRCALAAVAVGKGNTALAQAIIELDPDVTREFKTWLDSR